MMYRPEIADLALEEVSLVAAVEYGCPDGKPLHMDLFYDYLIAGPKPVIIWIHGGGFTEEEYVRFSRPEKRFVQLAKRGYVVASIDYRLAQEKPFPAQIQDCKCAVRFLRSHADAFGINPDAIGVWGESCGGQLAAEMAVQKGIPEFEDVGGWKGVSSKIQAAVCWYGGFNILAFTQMLEDPRFLVMYGGNWKEKKDLVMKASPITYVAEKLCPILSMCSDTDVRVPYEQSVEFCKMATENGNDATHITVPHQGHGYFEGETYYETLYAFFDKHLKK